MKNPYIIPAAMISAAILAGFWVLKSPSEQPQKVVIVQPPQPPEISIQMAVHDGNIEAVKQHLAYGTDMNWKDGGGWTPLHNAALKGRKEIAELLIAGGAEVNARTLLNYSLKGRTPLDFAFKYKQPELANLLRKHGGKTGEELKAEGK